jgi:acyl carrier protein
MTRTAQLERELLDALVEWGVHSDQELQSHSALITSGLLDSVALYSLSLWIEEKVGRPLDPATFDLAAEWDSPQRVVAFIERIRGEQGAAAAPAVAVAITVTTSPAVVAAHVTTSPDVIAPAVMTPPAAAASPARPSQAAVRTDLVAGYEIMRYEPRFKEAIATLQRRLWSNDAALNRTFFEWRYEENPHADDPLILLGFKDGELVAMRALFGSLWEAGPQRSSQPCYLSDDLVVLPGHESHGLFAAFTEMIRAELAARGQSFFLSLSALRVTRLQSIAGGARIVGAMVPHGRSPTSIRMLDSLRAGASKMPVLWRAARDFLAHEHSSHAFARLAGAPSVTRAQDGIASSDAARVADMARLVAALDHDGRIRQVRDERYLHWRFRNPLHQYCFVYAERDGALTGYLVLERAATERGNARRIHIADWEASSDATLEQLLAYVVQHGRPMELVTWTATLGAARTACLARSGFVPTDIDQAARGLPSIMVWPVNPLAPAAELELHGRKLLELDSWDLRMLDSSIA